MNQTHAAHFEFSKVTFSWRHILTMLTGFGMTLALFSVMYLVVAEKEYVPPQILPTPNIEWVTLQPAPQKTVTPLPPEPPPKPEKPPQMLQSRTAEGLQIVAGPVSPERPEMISRPRLVSDGDLARILAVAPEYPRRPLVQGVEGWVLLEFTVDEIGRVVMPRVVESTPEGVFNTAALRALKRYKYRPRIVNGSPVKVEGVRQLITFELQ